MANDSGTQKYWIYGQPSALVDVSTNKSGTQKYWINGQPSEYVFPPEQTITRPFPMFRPDTE